VTCRFCGAELPEGASFCGECGRSVVSADPEQARAALPEIVFSSEPDAEPPPRPAPAAESEFTCPQCGAPIDDDDVFCGECGFVLTSSYLSAPSNALGDPRDTTEIDPIDAAATDPDRTSAPQAAPAPEAPPAPEAAPAVEPAPEPTDGPPKVLRAAPDPFPWGKDTRTPPIDLEATRALSDGRVEERFVLQFSTGESVTVSGAGLVGRNPASQPGEFVDQLVTVFDAGKSVSKTHLEFGQENGRFWVSDRYSTNGSTVRQPDAEPKRCEPGRRYFIARGTRVDIGEQFFVVS
jgi:predicted nucleic acid-binding Zn ribbon protein